MESVTENQINIFSDQLPSLGQLEQLAGQVNSTEQNRMMFAQQIESEMPTSSGKKALAMGIGLQILGRASEAINMFQKAPDCVEKFYYMALALKTARKYDEAVNNFQKCIDSGLDSLAGSLQKAATYIAAKDYPRAENELQSCANYENVSAEYHYRLGQLLEAQGQYDKAADSYKVAIELAPNHSGALFRLAYRCDLSGDEEAAIDYYKQISKGSVVYLNALLNLAVLYEDRGDFEKASTIVNKILEAHPNHQRAILFKKDIDSSKTMYYDEEKEQKRSQKNQILETPISDFELSVRSRNCLRKMNIRTIGDLLNISEAELLSYKNFGETSLKEIKSILESKNMRLGMALEDKQFQPVDAISEIQDINDGIHNKSLDELQFSVRSRKCLQRLNVHSLGDLARTTEAELLGCKNFGVTSLNEIKKVLNSYGLSLRSLD
jgi:DNA-directed RNA polymerase subunit alpha